MIGRLISFVTAKSGSQFQQNFVRVARANVLALALPAIAAPLLTRLYVPEDFAVLAVFSAALALILSVATFRFDWVLPNASSTDQATCLFVAGLAVLVLSCITVSLVAFMEPQIIFADTPLRQLGWLVFLLPLALLAAGVRELYAGWFVWQGDLSAVSKATIAQSVVNVAASVSGGIASLSALGLVGALVLSAFAGITSMFRVAAAPLRAGLSSMNRSGFKAAVRRHGKTAAISTIASFGNAASLSAPVLLLASAYAPREVGWFILVHRLVAAPMGTLTNALAKSFWSRAAELARTGAHTELSSLYRRTTVKLALSSIPVVLVCLCGPFFVGPVFGQDWVGAGYVLLVMIPMFVGSLVFAPTNHVVVLEKKHFQLYADGLRLLLTVAGVWLAASIGLDFLWAVAFVSVASFVGHAFLFPAHLWAYKTYV